jgi:hypothetical protein
LLAGEGLEVGFAVVYRPIRGDGLDWGDVLGDSGLLECVGDSAKVADGFYGGAATRLTGTVTGKVATK